MITQPLTGLLYSRKFLLLVLDTTISLVTYFVTKYANPLAADDALVVIAALQPVFLMLIYSIAKEDVAAVTVEVAKIEAASAKSSATIAASVPAVAPPAAPQLTVINQPEAAVTTTEENKP